MKEKTIMPFDIFWAKLEENNERSLQGGVRPVIILCCLAACVHSPIIHAIPLSKNLEKSNKKRFPQHMLIPFGKEGGSTALTEQLTCIHKSQLLGSRVGNISDPGIRKELATVVLKQLGIFDVVTN